MSRRLLLCFATICVFLLRAADGDGEIVSFSLPSKVGTTVVPPGLYRIKMQGAVVFLTDSNTRKSFSALVKIEKTPKRSGFTAAQGPTAEGVQQVVSIVLQGADFKLIF